MPIMCDICLSNKLLKSNVVSTFTVYRCKNCKSAIVSPKPSKLEISLYNENRYRYSREQEIAYLKKRKVFKLRAQRCVNSILKYKKSGCLLDVGCSYGFYLLEFKKKGFITEGIDNVSKAVKYARYNLHLNVHHSDFYKYKCKDGQFDVITLFDVFEHFTNISTAIKKIKRILKKDGLLIIQTPNHNSLISLLTRNKWFWLLIPEHLRLFTPFSISYFLNKNGFKILELKTWDDFDEFIKNILFVLHLKDKGMTKYFYYLLYYFLRMFSPLSTLWSKILLGGEIEIYAQRQG